MATNNKPPVGSKGNPLRIGASTKDADWIKNVQKGLYQSIEFELYRQQKEKNKKESAK